MFNPLFNKGDCSNSSKDSSDPYVNKKDALQLKSELNSQFEIELEKIKNNRTNEVPNENFMVNLKEEFNQIINVNSQKQEKISKIINEIRNAKERSPLNFDLERRKIETMQANIDKIEENIFTQVEEKKKMILMKGKIEKLKKNLMKNIEEKNEDLEKITSQCKRLKNECLYLKNNENLAILNKNNFLSATSAYKNDFENKTLQLRGKIESFKNNYLKIIDKMAKNGSSSKNLIEKKQILISNLKQHLESSSNIQVDESIKERLVDFKLNFEKISKILGFGTQNLSEFVIQIIEWLKKSEFQQISLTLNYLENVNTSNTKKTEFKELFIQKENIINTTESLNPSKNLNYESKNKLFAQNEIVSNKLEKMTVNLFYKIFFLVRNSYLYFKYIENHSNYKDLRFNKLNFAIEEILNRFEVSKVSVNEIVDENQKNFTFDSGFLQNLAYLKNSELIKLLQSANLNEIASKIGSKSIKNQPFLFITKCHKFLTRNFQKLLKYFVEFLLLLKQSTNDISSTINSLSNNLSKSPKKFLARIKSLYESKSRVSFLVAEDSAGPFIKNEISSLEQILTNRKIPEIKLKKHKRLNSDSNLIFSERKIKFEPSEIESKIHDLKMKGKNIKKEIFSVKELVKFPQKYIIKPDFVKRLYISTQSSHSLQPSPKLRK